MREVGHQVLDHRHVRQRVDLDVASGLVLDRADARQRVDAIDVHRARTTNGFTAGTAQGQGRVDLVLDLEQRVQNHRPAGGQVHLEAVDARVLPVVGRPAVDTERARLLCIRRRVAFARLDLGVPRQREFTHGIALQYARKPDAGMPRHRDRASTAGGRALRQINTRVWPAAPTRLRR